nr:reverse transcriptase domain-containing protein [Tanacetum cinerariifolium]
MTKPYSSTSFIANYFITVQVKMEMEIPRFSGVCFITACSYSTDTSKELMKVQVTMNNQAFTIKKSMSMAVQLSQAQDGETPQVDDQRLYLADDLKEAQKVYKSLSDLDLGLKVIVVKQIMSGIRFGEKSYVAASENGRVKKRVDSSGSYNINFSCVIILSWARNGGKEQPKAVKKGETSEKEKALAILMVQPWERVARQKITQSFSPNTEILFPPLDEEERKKGTMIIEAEIGGYCIDRMYLDGGSASEIIIIGRPGVRKLQAVSLTAYGMLKLQVERGVITLKSSRLVPLECALVSGPEETLLATKPILEERVKVEISPQYMEQAVMIGFTLTEGGRNKLCGLLQRNLDIFAWKAADMTDVPRHIVEHRLNVRRGDAPRERGVQANETANSRASHADVLMEKEELIVYLAAAKETANADSRLVANQVNGTYVAKEVDMIRYLEDDARSLIRACQDCQVHKHVPTNPQQNLPPITSPWPFYKWGIDIAGPFPEGPGKVKFLLVAIDYFTKFGLSGEIISDNGKQFRDNPFKDCLGEGIKASLDARSKNWMEELPHVLWAHHTMIKSSNGDTLFSLTYRTKAVVLAKIGMPTLRTAEVDLVQNDEALGINLNLLEEKREQAAIREAKSKAKMEKYYNSKVQSVSFKPGDLVYRNNDASRTKDTWKLGPKW